MLCMAVLLTSDRMHLLGFEKNIRYTDFFWAMYHSGPSNGLIFDIQ